MEAVKRIVTKYPYHINVAFLALSQWGDLALTKGMIAKQGDWVEDSPRKEYFLSNMHLVEVLKVIAIPAIIITIAYLSQKIMPHHQEKITTALRILNTGMACVLIVNMALNLYTFH